KRDALPAIPPGDGAQVEVGGGGPAPQPGVLEGSPEAPQEGLPAMEPPVVSSDAQRPPLRAAGLTPASLLLGGPGLGRGVALSALTALALLASILATAVAIPTPAAAAIPTAAIPIPAIAAAVAVLGRLRPGVVAVSFGAVGAEE